MSWSENVMTGSTAVWNCLPDMLLDQQQTLKPQAKLRGCVDFSQKQRQDAGKLDMHRKSTAIPDAIEEAVKLLASLSIWRLLWACLNPTGQFEVERGDIPIGLAGVKK